MISDNTAQFSDVTRRVLREAADAGHESIQQIILGEAGATHRTWHPASCNFGHAMRSTQALCGALMNPFGPCHLGLVEVVVVCSVGHQVC